MSENKFIRPIYKEDGLHLVISMNYDFLKDTQSYSAGDMVEIFADIVKREIMADMNLYYKEHIKRTKDTDDRE